jgi:hypothetical protein
MTQQRTPDRTPKHTSAIPPKWGKRVQDPTPDLYLERLVEKGRRSKRHRKWRAK